MEPPARRIRPTCPVAATFPLSQVRDAYRRPAQGHLLGKIVLLT